MNKTLLWRPYDPAYIRDPYAMYRILREQDPVHLAQTREFIITGYDHVKEILKSPSFQTGNRLEWIKRGIHYLENKQEDFSAIADAMNSFVLMLNGAQHQRIRNFVTRAWDNRQADAIIQSNINSLLNNTSQREMDVVSQFAQPLPMLTISRIMGLPTADYEYLKELGLTLTKTLDLYVSLKELVVMNDAARKLISFFQEQIRLKYDKPDDGLLSKLIQKNKTENIGLTENELISIGIFLFIAGEETSASLISTGLYNVMTHPTQLEILKSDPAKIDLAVEEILRFDSVVQLLGRIAREDYQLGDTLIPAGATVTLVIGSANRDEKAFANSATFDITRHPNRHLAFGSGVHFCLGDWLGKKMGQMGIASFLQKFPNAALIEPQQLSWYKNLAIRSLTRLMFKV